jgi:hypothetical protein
MSDRGTGRGNAGRHQDGRGRAADSDRHPTASCDAQVELLDEPAGIVSH